MTSFRPNRAAVTLISLFMTACAADTQWAKPGVDAPQMLRDLSECRTRATIQAEKEYAIDQQSLRGTPIDAERDLYRERMMAFEATKRRNALTERCMNDRGYQKAGRT
ncbi:MAG: hypothetical protein WD407_09930 [Rhodospirillales bacterium]